jgi:hypothetical protein
MITEKLKELVRIEADNLRKHASGSELSKLDFDSLDVNNTQLCVYGQMTGFCHSPRAIELIKSSAQEFVFVNEDSGFIELEFENFKNRWIRKEFKSVNSVEYSERYFSPIETYIYQTDAKNKELIEYLRGETDTLEL